MTQRPLDGTGKGDTATAPPGAHASVQSHRFRDATGLREGTRLQKLGGPLSVSLLVALLIVLSMSLARGSDASDWAPLIGLIAATCFIYWQLRQQQAELAVRKNIELALRESEDRYSRIFRSSPVAIIVQSADDRVVLDVNPAFERLYGYERDEYVGTVNDYSLWDDPAERSRLAREVVQHGCVTGFQARGTRKDGSTFNALVAVSLEGVGPGQIVVSNIADVSTETRARDAARQSQELFTKAFDFSPMNMTITRVSDGMFLAVNAAEDLVQGYEASELLGRTSLDAGAWLNPSDRQTFFDQLNSNGQVLRYETQMRHKNGHLVDCMLWGVIVDIAGEPCVLSSTINTTKEKRRERQLLELARGVAGETGERFFHQLVEHLARALDADMVMAGEVQDGGYVRSLGFIKDGAQMPPTTFATAGTTMGAVLARAGLYTYEEGMSGDLPDEPLIAGTYASHVTHVTYATYAAIALSDDDGTPIGILKAAWRNPLQTSGDREALFSIFASRCNAELVRLRRDREILRLNETLEQRVKARTSELQASNAELESFSYSVSHDLKAPLSSIDGFTALLLRRMGARMDAEEQRMFERVRTNVARMHELITALLSLAQVSRYKLERQQVDLSVMARDWFDAELAREPQREVQTSVQQGVLVQADKRMARIVLENLLGNAWKYTRKKQQARIEFGVQVKDGVPELFVRDNGVGFDMDHAAHLFKPFHRLQNVSDYDGSGIGLATVHRILERHGGHIRADSRVDEGAGFYFSFEPREEAG
jgi:PAS domain S-box-containing protein